MRQVLLSKLWLRANVALPIMPRVCQALQMLRVRFRGSIDMARLIARIRIMPADAESNLDTVVHSIKSSMPEGFEMKGHAMEPIAFGLKAIVGDFLLDDAEGQMDRLEETIKNVEGVGEIDVMNISRQSVKMK